MKALAMIVAALLGAYMLMQVANAKNDCEDSGGHYVRGFSGWECVR